jgi:hypothetical protein
MTRTPTKPPTDRGMQRKLKALVHPDNRGDHELFIWTVNLIEAACLGSRNAPKEVEHPAAPSPHYSSPEAVPARIPYDAALGFADEFVTLTLRAVSVGRHAEEPYRSVLALLIDCPADYHGRAAAKQGRGASYRQLGRIAHDAGMTPGQRRRWYDLARSIPLSEKHASHLIDRMSGRRAA